MTRTCTACGFSDAEPTHRFCVTCGAELRPVAPAPFPVPLPAPALDPPRAGSAPQPVTIYSSSLIAACRVLSAACMLSAILAVVNFDTRSTAGRILIVASVSVSFFGQLFAMKASKPTPPPWIGFLLPCFWIGLTALPILWLIRWGQR